MRPPGLGSRDSTIRVECDYLRTVLVALLTCREVELRVPEECPATDPDGLVESLLLFWRRRGSYGCEDLEVVDKRLT